MKQITPFTISSPGFYGLNLQDSPVDMNAGFALEATNCVIDRSGRIASRNGWAKVNAANTDLGTSNIECIGELITNGGTSYMLAAGGGFLFTLSGSTLTTLTYGGGGSAPTISANNWQFCQLNGVAMFWQRGYDPLIFEPGVSTTTFRRLNERSGASGTVQQANTAISAYGRVWCADLSADKNTVYFSDLLAPHVWTGGTSGSLNLANVWPSGGDTVVGMAAHNNFLLIFGKKQTLVYQGANDPASMQLSDSIVGTGCVARDSIANTGEDIIFLSTHGVISFNRVIQEKSAPIRPLSKNVLEEIQSHVSVSDIDTIKAVYSSVNSFYVITMPSFSESYCFDLRELLPNGAAKVTTWTSINPKCMIEASNRSLYIGKAGYVGLYSTYLDDTAPYRMTYKTPWIDFGNPVQTSILKKIMLLIIGATNQTITFKWAYDFSTMMFAQQKTISGRSVVAEFNAGIEFNSGAEYSSNQQIDTLAVNGSSSGKVLQFGFEANIIGKSISLQKIDLYTKEGRL